MRLCLVVVPLLVMTPAAPAGLCPPGFTCDCKVTTPSVPAGAAWGTVHNPSFEGGFTGGVGTYWTATYGHFVSNPTFSDSTLRATNGSHSQRIDIPECAQYYTSQRVGIYQQIYVVPGQTYTVTVDVYMELDQGESYSGENMTANVGLDPYGDTRIHEGSVKWSGDQGDKNAWRTMTVSTTAVFEVMTVYVDAMRKWPGFGNGRIWIDNLVVSGPVPTTPPSPPEEEPPDPDADIPETTGGELAVNGGFEGSWSSGLASGWSSWSTAGSGYWKQSTRIGKVGAGKYDYGEADTVANMNPKTALTMQLGDADYWGAKPNMIDTVIVGRLFIDHLMGTYLSNPTYYGRVHADNCWTEQQYHPRVDCWQGCNEPGWGGTDWNTMIEFEKSFAERCHELGMKAITLNVSVGSPGNIWRMLEADELLAVTDYVGYHSYGGPNDQLMINNANYDPPCDYSLRWRKYADMYRDRGWRMPPVIYTEGTTYAGWHGVFQPSQIRDDLIAFGGYMNEDRWCTGLTLFVAGGTGEWANWDIRNQGDIAAACGTWNSNNPSEATAGLYSQQFGAGEVHPMTLSAMQNPNAAFTGGIKQQITGLAAGNMYLLDLDFRYEFRGFQPQVAFYTGVDLTGQTSNPSAASINWSSDIIAEENAVHEIWERTWRTFTATGSTASIWIKAAQAVSNPAYRISIDRVSVKQVAAPPTAPAISLSPTTLSPTCVQGNNAANQTFTVANSGVNTLSYSITDNQTWLSCSPTSGTSTGEQDTITVSYSTSGLSAGTYNATITVSDPNASNNPQTIPVTLTVTPPAVSAIEDFETMPSWSSSFDGSWGSAAAWSIVAGGQSGNALQASRSSQGSSVKAKTYAVTANTTYTVSIYVKCPSYSANSYWAECAVKAGSNTAEDFDNNGASWTMIQKFANDGTNGNGNTWTKYSTTLSSGANTQITLGIKLGSSGGAGPTVQWDTLRIAPQGAVPSISRSPATLSPSCAQGGNPANQTFTVANGGLGILEYSISDNVTWLSCSPTGGTSTGEQDTITVTYAASGLSAGTHNGTITISDPAASNNPQTIAVTLTVSSPPPTISLSPTTLSPSCAAGSNASNQTFTVQNTGSGTLNYSISDNVSWLSCSPTSGTSTGEADTITVSYTTSGLSAGTHNATITVSDPNATNNPQTIAVTLTVTAAPTITRSPSSLSRSCTQGSNASSQTFTVQNTGGGTLNYSITDNVTWLSCSPTSGTSTGETDTITVSYSTSGLAVGTYSATITISDPSATNNPQTISVSLTVNKKTVTQNFESMPSWSSSYDASWGGAATWSIVSGGQSGNCLQASRSNNGSSAKVMVYNISPSASYTVSIYIKCPSASGSYWAECAYKLGSYTASDFDNNSGTWTMIKKFDSSANGNGNVWTQYSKTFNSGTNTQISVGHKLGLSSGSAPAIRWDTLRVQ